MKTAVLHPIIEARQTARTPQDALEEATALTQALDLDVAYAVSVPLHSPRPGTLFGSGKLEELGRELKSRDIGLVIIDGPVTPVQQRNLERKWKVKLLDRTGLILEIFADRAATREGKLQVDLAHLNYQKTRLVRSWTHLERQRGGLGFVGGPGETQIEADRRALTDQIQKIRKQLSKVVKTRGLHRQSRQKVPYKTVALVGYTNAGKSTLFNRLTGEKVLAKDLLFATLDPKMKKLELPSGEEIILSDTVGFISDLPTQLVAAFRATLEEVLEADLILHVVDASHPEFDAQIGDVNKVLSEIGIDEGIPQLELWNKIDLMDGSARESLENRLARSENAQPISAMTGEGLSQMVTRIDSLLAEPRITDNIELEFSQGRHRAWLFDHNLVKSEEQSERGYRLEVEWTDKEKAQYAAL